MKSPVQEDLFAPRNMPVYTVSELRDVLSRMVKTSFASHIIVKGVISSQPKLYPSYVFFDIRDEKKNMSFTVYGYIGAFYNIQNKIKKTGVTDTITPELPVMLVVEPTVSTQKNISFRLNIIDIVPEYTSSVLASAKDITIKKLVEEGIFGNQKKFMKPLIYKRLGLITSDQGTSVQDICTAAGSALRHIDIIFRASRVEGSTAVSSITEAINLFNEHRDRLQLDAIIIARGGGSSVDLAVFDDYSLCKAVCNSRVPVITAIGHDKDEHAIELCSFLTPMPSTPSGIGSYIRDTFIEAEQQLGVLANSIITEITERFYREQNTVRENINTVLSSIKKLLAVHTVRLSSYVSLIASSIKGIKYKKIELNLKNIYNFINTVKNEASKLFQYSEERLQNSSRLLEAYDHRAILGRGYSVTKDSDGRVIKLKDEMPETAYIEFYDGDVRVRRDA